jgi:transposase-like protein
VQVTITKLIDDVQCYQTVRELRWPDGVQCPSCASQQVIKRGCDDTEPARQRYACHDCHTRFDDVTDTIFGLERTKVRKVSQRLLSVRRVLNLQDRDAHRLQNRPLSSVTSCDEKAEKFSAYHIKKTGFDVCIEDSGSL